LILKLLEFCFVVYFQYHEITAVQAANKHSMLYEFGEVDSLDDILHHPDTDENHQEEVEEVMNMFIISGTLGSRNKDLLMTTFG